MYQSTVSYLVAEMGFEPHDLRVMSSAKLVHCDVLPLKNVHFRAISSLFLFLSFSLVLCYLSFILTLKDK